MLKNQTQKGSIAKVFFAGLVFLFSNGPAVAQNAKFVMMFPPEKEKSGYSVKIVSADGTDETNLNDNTRYALSGAEARNTINLNANSKLEVSEEFGRIATAIFADLGLKPEHPNKNHIATFADTSNDLLADGGWTFIPKSEEAFKGLVAAIKFLGSYREGPVSGTVTKVRVVIVPLDLRFGHGQAAFLPRIKVIVSGNFKAGRSPFPMVPTNQDSSKVEKSILIAFRKRCFDDQAKAVEALAETIQGDEGIPADGRKAIHANFLEWGKNIRSGKPKLQFLQELDKLVKAIKSSAKSATVEQMMKVGNYLTASGSDIYLVNL